MQLPTLLASVAILLSLFCLLFVFLLLAIIVARTTPASSTVSTTYMLVYQFIPSLELRSHIPDHEQVPEEPWNQTRCKFLFNVHDDSNLAPVLQTLAAVEGGGEIVPVSFLPIPLGIAKNMPRRMCIELKKS